MEQEIMKILQGITVWKIVIILSAIALLFKAIKSAAKPIKEFSKQYELLEKQEKEMRKISKQMDYNNNGTLSILRYRIRRECQKALLQNYITIEVLEDLTKMYQAYKDLGGNGSVEALYKRAEKLPTRKEQK